MLKRFGLFVLTNLAILFVLNIVLVVLERAGVFGGEGLFNQYGPLMVMSAAFGFGGSFFSLAISKWMAKRSVGAVVIEPAYADRAVAGAKAVARHAQAAGIGMPEVAIYQDPTPNAFATGARRDASLVAVRADVERHDAR